MNEEFSEKLNSLAVLVNSQDTLLLATTASDSTPDLSYAPYVRDEAGIFYIFISQLASHTVNLLTNPKASVMFIRAEVECKNLFARERAVFKCCAQFIKQDESAYNRQLNALQEKFGETVSLLWSLNDFYLFALIPESCRYIAGFGQAFDFKINDGILTPA